MIISSNKVYGFKKNKYLITKYDEVNVRNGPGLNNLILFKILKKGYPLLIVENFEDWFRIEDVEGRKGWVSKTQLSNQLSAIVISSAENIYKFPNRNSKVLAIVKRNFVIEVAKCRENWCKVSEKEIKGWVNKDGLWGIK